MKGLWGNYHLREKIRFQFNWRDKAALWKESEETSKQNWSSEITVRDQQERGLSRWSRVGRGRKRPLQEGRQQQEWTAVDWRGSILLESTELFSSNLVVQLPSPGCQFQQSRNVALLLENMTFVHNFKHPKSKLKNQSYSCKTQHPLRKILFSPDNLKFKLNSGMYLFCMTWPV